MEKEENQGVVRRMWGRKEMQGGAGKAGQEEQCQQLKNCSKPEAEDEGKRATWAKPVCQAPDTQHHHLYTPFLMKVNLLWHYSISQVLT